MFVKATQRLEGILKMPQKALQVEDCGGPRTPRQQGPHSPDETEQDQTGLTKVTWWVYTVAGVLYMNGQESETYKCNILALTSKKCFLGVCVCVFVSFSLAILPKIIYCLWFLIKHFNQACLAYLSVDARVVLHLLRQLN